MPLSLLCAYEERELIVPLSTRSFLSSVSISPLKGSAFSEDYLKTLREILEFDLNQNGSCSVEPQEGSDFHIDLELIGKNLSALIELKRGGVTKTLGPYALCGTLSSDRRVLHKFHDDLAQIITGKRGIASSQILFAIQFPEKTPQGYEWRSEIWGADYDGENKRQITGEHSYCISPVFLPYEGDYTRGKFLYVNYKKGQPKLYIAPLNAQRGEPFLSLRGNQLLPTLSPKGDLLAFISDASGR
ncbi:MAG: hypothetical protein KDK64_07485, partial [Chlamydiia bacterium]|nr:hypothetical protein [Chlamydiia bacterium]